MPQGSAGVGPGGAGLLPGAGLYPGITDNSHDLLTNLLIIETYIPNKDMKIMISIRAHRMDFEYNMQ